MPPKRKGCSVAFFDAKSSPEYKEQAVTFYREVAERIYFSDDSGVIKIYLTNTKKEPSGRTLFSTDFRCHHPSDRKYLEEAVPADPDTDCDWLDDLRIAAGDLSAQFDPRAYLNYKMIVLSDLKTPLKATSSEIEEKIEQIVKYLKEIDGYIYFVGIDIQPDYLLTQKKSVYEWAKNINVDESNVNYNIAAKIIRESKGVMCDFNMGADLFITYGKGSRGYPFVEPLSFGDELKIPTSTVRLINDPSKLTIREQQHFKKEKFVLLEDQDVEVDREDVASGLASHDKLIIVPQDVSKGIRNYSRFFKILGFTDKKNVPVHYMLSEATSLVTNYKQKDPEVGYINYLIEAAAKHNKYGIALKAHMANSQPKLFCLIPKTNPHYFLMVQLPFAQDFVCLYSESQPKTDPTESLESKAGPSATEDDEMEKDVFAYLRSINLDSKLGLHPHRRMSDTKKRLVSFLTDKEEHRPLKETDLNPFGIQFDTNPELFAKIKKYCDHSTEEEAKEAEDTEEKLW